MKESIRAKWRAVSATHPFAEVMDQPSMCEPSPSISLEQMVRDYSRGIIHSSRIGYYDYGEDIPEDFHEPEDISEVHEFEAKLRSRRRKSLSSDPPVEPLAPESDSKSQDPETVD